MLAYADVSVNTITSNVNEDWESSDEITLFDVANKKKKSNETATPLSKKKHQSKRNPVEAPAQWRSVDSTKGMQLNQWNQPSPKFDVNLYPHQIFELFLPMMKCNGSALIDKLCSTKGKSCVCNDSRKIQILYSNTTSK